MLISLDSQFSAWNEEGMGSFGVTVVGGHTSPANWTSSDWMLSVSSDLLFFFFPLKLGPLQGSV